MENLKYTKTEDIQKFLNTLGYSWSGKFPKNLSQSFDDLPYGVSIVVCEEDNIATGLKLCVSDTSFLIEINNPNKKYDCVDHSLMWQLFMLKRKGKKYAKLIYTKSLKESEETKKEYDNKVSLLIKRAEKLAFERNLKIAHSNTALLNASSKLTPEEIEKINAEYSINN